MKSREEILKAVANKSMSIEEATRLLEALQPTKALHCKVSAKGGLSVYGMGKWPLTLYVEQWERLLAFTDELRKFMEEHNSEFKRKGEDKDDTK